VVGVNRFTETEKGSGTVSGSSTVSSSGAKNLSKDSAVPSENDSRPLFAVDPNAERRQVERARAVRASRSASDWETSLADVAKAARASDNLVPPIIAAVTAKATLGEIADTLRDVFGTYEDTSGA